ncbi:MAG TPA: hypothetical protein VFN67_16145 [Polyangiales bacterium]|nr:hypothetical protein [Polyangiales bacterium]
MANLASAVWQDESAALILALHTGLAPSDAEWDRYCSWISGLLPHPNGACVVLTDGGAPSTGQRERLRKQLGTEARWTAVITDKPMVRGVVTAIRWINPKVCAFTPWEFPEAFKFIGVRGGQIPSICVALRALDAEMSQRSRVLAEALRHVSEAG